MENDNRKGVQTDPLSGPHGSPESPDAGDREHSPRPRLHAHATAHGPHAAPGSWNPRGHSRRNLVRIRVSLGAQAAQPAGDTADCRSDGDMSFRSEAKPGHPTCVNVSAKF